MNFSSVITRQELLRLKRRLMEVRLGYNLLEQKRDALIKTFMELKETFLERKGKLYEQLQMIIGIFDKSVKVNPVAAIELLSLDKDIQSPELEVKSQSIMGVKTTIFSLKKFSPPRIDEELAPQSYLEAVKKLADIMPELIEVSSLEDALIKLAYAIEKTRRRVNVLKDITIPSMKRQIEYISLRLSDQERERFVFNLKFKQQRAKK